MDKLRPAVGKPARLGAVADPIEIEALNAGPNSNSMS